MDSNLPDPLSSHSSSPASAGNLSDALPARIHQYLASFLAQRREETAAMDSSVASAVDDLTRLVLTGGKRMRPRFAWWGWRAAGGTEAGPSAQATLFAASAIELLHTGALIHDDLIDESATRRGEPTIHVRYAEKHRVAEWQGNARCYGRATAVLVGDLALAWADDMLHAAGLEPQALLRAMRPWRAMRTEVLAGQYLDMLSQARSETSSATALRVAELKSASYTIQRPLELGAEIAGAHERVTEALRAYGADLGVAFQLRDDVLGVFGDPATTGKPAGDDLREGKRTLLITRAFEHAAEREDAAATEVLTGALGNPDLNEDQLSKAREALLALGAVKAIEDRIDELADRALQGLANSDITPEAHTELSDLVWTVANRSS